MIDSRTYTAENYNCKDSGNFGGSEAASEINNKEGLKNETTLCSLTH